MLAAPDDVLDLRVAAALDQRWASLGFTELVPGELTCPVDVVLTGVEQTRRLGVRLAASLRAGDLVVLSGPLGAGKTTLTQGIGAGLGVRGAVTSPTFVLARIHPGPVPLVHADAYRLRDTSAAPGAVALDDLDLDDVLPDSVAVVEWGEGIVEPLSPSRLEVVLAHAGTCRTARVRAHGPRWAVVQPPCVTT